MESTTFFHQHFITNPVIPFDPGVVLVGSVMICLTLSISPSFVPVGYKGHVKKHVPPEKWEALSTV